MSQDFPGCPVVNTSPSGAKGAGSNPGQGAKTPHASQPKNQNKKQKQYCNKFSTDFLTNGPCQKNLKKKKELNWTQILRKDIISGLRIVLRSGHLAG